MTTNIYGSKKEQAFHQRFPELIPIHQRNLKHNKRDVWFDDGAIKFNAQADFYHTETKSLIEYKCDKLNKYKQRDDADYARGNTSNMGRDYQYKDWSNSMYKHLIVQLKMNEYGYNYVIVFDKATKLSKQQEKSLTGLNVNWCYERDFNRLLNK